MAFSSVSVVTNSMLLKNPGCERCSGPYIGSERA